MCVVSMINDYGRREFWPRPGDPWHDPFDIDPFKPGLPGSPLDPYRKIPGDKLPPIDPAVDLERLREFQKLIEAAKQYDKKTKQPHCEDPEKAKVMEAVDARVKELEAELGAARDEAKTELDLMRERKDGAYLERNQCVSLIARMALKLGYDVKVCRTAIEGWSEDWHGCVYITLPTGQVSWHFHDSQAYLFDRLPKGEAVWDGHDTPTKYERVMTAFADQLEDEHLFGSSNLPSHIGIGGEQVQLGTVVARAFKDSGLTTNAWNDLPERTREHRLVDAIADMRAEAEAADLERRGS